MDSELFAGAHVRLRGRRLVFLLDLTRNAEPTAQRLLYETSRIRQLRPEQRNVAATVFRCFLAKAEAVATRRALAAFAHLQTQCPGHPVSRHDKLAVATAFKMDPDLIFGRRALKALTSRGR